MSRWMRILASVLVLMSCLLNMAVETSAMTHNRPLKIVRVGYFKFDGYHDKDELGNKSGYGYEVLQQMNRYENWVYEYVGYDKSWGEMLDMLERGEIDMLTSADVSDERLTRFDYSNISVGINSTILTVRQNDMRYAPGNYASYDGMRVGMLRVNGKNADFIKFAQKNNIDYIPVYYDDSDQLEYALHESKEIDAILTGSMRRIDGERIIDEFDIRPSYVIVKKGNKELLNEINHALVNMSIDDPLWTIRLKYRYYNIAESDVINLSFEDKELLKHLNSDHKVFRVLVDTDNRPYSFYDEMGQIRGIVVDLFAIMADKLGVKYEFLPVHSKADYKQALASGAVDIILDAKFSLQETERLGFHNVGTYMRTPLALYYKRARGKQDLHRVATITDLSDEAHSYFDRNKITVISGENVEKCLEMLADDEVDALFINSQSASDFLANDYRNEYMSIVLPEHFMEYSLLVNGKEYILASSFFAKACASITNRDVELVSLKYKDMAQSNIDLKTYIRMKPFLFLGLAAVVLILICLALTLQIKRKREIAKNNETLKEANAFLTERDALTGGYNRQGFLNVAAALRQKVDLSEYVILFIDIKNIKAINELLGVAQGDNVLRLLYKNLKESFMKPVIVSRIESDHFVSLVERKNLDYNRLNELLIIKQNINGREMKIFCRCGVYEIVDPNLDLAKMVNNARMARRYMGNDFHESYIIYKSYMSNDYVDQAEVLSTYEGALANNEFKVYYQPIVHTATGRIASAEALIRWVKPDKKMVSPGLFVPVLEKNGLISQLDKFMAESVYAFLLERQEKGLFRVPVSVNLSWMDFYDEHLVAGIMDKACTGKLDKKTIRYEITETTYSNMESSNQELLAKLREYGVDIVLDDFGSGYSSFGMLQDYHFAILKLDMSFIRKLAANVKVQLIVQAIVDMCHRLKIRVVAEGVEQEREVQILRDMGCDYIQGYYFSKPLSQEEFMAYLEKESKLVE